jgi:hypothetical protein
MTTKASDLERHNLDDGPTALSSAVTSARVRQLRGQQKLVISTTTNNSEAPTAARSSSSRQQKTVTIKSPTTAHPSKPQKRPRVDDDDDDVAGSSKVMAQGAHTQDDVDDAESAKATLSSDEDVEEITIQDQCKRTTSHRVRSKDKRRADLDLVFKQGKCQKDGRMLEGWWCVLCKYIFFSLYIRLF